MDFLQRRLNPRRCAAIWPKCGRHLQLKYRSAGGGVGVAPLRLFTFQAQLTQKTQLLFSRPWMKIFLFFPLGTPQSLPFNPFMMEIHLAASGEFTYFMTNTKKLSFKKKKKEIRQFLRKSLKFRSWEAAGGKFIPQKERLWLGGGGSL